MTIELRPYLETAGRIHGRPGREVRPKSITIDSHCHLHIHQAEATVAGLVDIKDIPLMYWVSPETAAVNKKQMEDRFDAITDLKTRIDAMDEMGVDFQIIAPTPNQCYYWVAGEPGLVATRQVNDGLAAAVAQHPDKFAAIGTIPMQNPAEAVKELDRCIGTLGFKGVQILTWIHGKEISDPSHDVVWKRIEELGVPIFLHPNGFKQGERFTAHYFSNLIANPLETAMAIQRLIFDGVLERFPKLKIYCAHGGGYLPSYHARMDHAWGARPDCRMIIQSPPSFYLKKMWFDTVVFSYEQLEYLVRVYGMNKIIMGTDYPFDMADSDPIGHVMNCPGLSDVAKTSICGGNSIELFNLDVRP